MKRLLIIAAILCALFTGLFFVAEHCGWTEPALMAIGIPVAGWVFTRAIRGAPAAWRNRKLLKAVMDGDADAVRSFFDQGADVNANDGYDCALSFAGRSPYANAGIVKLLLDRGANIHGAPAGKGVQPLLRASHQSDPERIALLLEAGGDVNALQNHTPGLTPFQELVRWADILLLQLALTKGADVNKRSLGKECSSLHIAAAVGRHDLIDFLIEQGADVRARTKEGLTPLEVSETAVSRNQAFANHSWIEMLNKTIEKLKYHQANSLLG